MVVDDVAKALVQARILVFDFDGTLIDSNPIKRAAFAACFTDVAERREEILAYCWGHHHVPRGEKFRHVYERILRQPYTPEVASRLHARFDDATTRQIIAAPEIPGATAFLRYASGRYDTALLSSTPQEVLRHILAERGWLDYFTYVQGAPIIKAEWLRRLRQLNGLAAEAILFFGDTPEDAASADRASCRFIQVGGQAGRNASALTIPNFLRFQHEESDDHTLPLHA